MDAPTKSTRKTQSAETDISTKQCIKEVKEKVKDFCNNKKNANNLIDVIAIFQGEDVDVLLVCIRSLHKIFVDAITDGDMCIATTQSSQSLITDLPKAEKYKLWLRERYSDVKERLLDLLLHHNANIQELSLCTLVKFVEGETLTPLQEVTNKQFYFPVPLFESVLVGLLSSSSGLTSLVSRFQEYLEYDDLRYFSMKLALKDLKSRQDVTEAYLSNLYALLENLSMPSEPPEDQRLTNFLSKSPENPEKLKSTSYKEHKKLFTSVWLEFLKKKLPTSIYKKVLVVLHDKVMPHMTSPLLLSDFLTQSYNIGGAISLLALNGLFILVHNHNLNYPDFYEKLYSLFEPGIFHVKYKARFFYLADLFLTSTLLPAYLVAAFAKKLSRLALTAPPNCLLIILPFIHNLLTRHPSCQILIHKPDGLDIESDPYRMEERDLVKCNALDSSLWEIKTLQSHFHHTVAAEAKRFDHKLNEREIDLGPLLETSIGDMLEKECKRKVKEIPLTFTPAENLFGGTDGQNRSSLWVLS